ncbi:GNAT family N-acetyltransferase [Actinomycetospora cinnamomea]|uniref:Ribosomal protein S18 acetylase RimI-like enzyme n=1 Tax=Actinomycetospora cinnamomea TaxID=663609 RepID=A0A2U1E7V0_9PSEU|nr:GNAT family N-acetyltransferase [Actinomycetospora cinnamomea]PVY96011.1 ribosomal protein S18 acetylase RimI-like enzyme [Actinomycetospora cinnamomea]
MTGRWHLRDARPGDLEDLVRVWRRAVEATHDFLTPGDVDGFSEQLRRDLPRAAVRVAVAPGGGALVGFLAARSGEVDMLFVDPSVHGRGVGTALLEEVAARHPVLTVEVNEQNPVARAWYERRGFVRVGRSATDADGRPFPILHLRRSVGRCGAAGIRAPMTGGRGEAPGDRRDEALDDAADDALSETDVDPTGQALHNEAVDRKERSAEEHGGS